ncbi:MarR family transcriptional regulator [Mesorhizobium sp. SP-1A]|uniref:MarR family winged helix-turn-helix transcriptional regulator n=1 Tax=Mesorhizobium sp. SP-1A TaxID=3077840 RepID=UPI0028F6DA17|nr:MarR family transcriptional regulator [Mesorhizobium sp. SP-1A]
MKAQPPASPDISDLDSFLCFAIYSAGLAFNRVYRRQLDRLGLTYPQYLVMVALWQEDDVTIGHLGERLSLDTNTLTPMLKRLEAMGLLTRRRDSADERRVLVSLTDRGRSIRTDARDIMRCIVEATGLSDDKLAGLTKEMQVLRQRLEQYAERQEDRRS